MKVIKILRKDSIAVSTQIKINVNINCKSKEFLSKLKLKKVAQL